MHRSKKASLDHLVRAGEQGRWDGEAKHARGLVVDNKLELRRLRHRQVCGLRALEDAAGIRVPAPEVENIVVQALREHLNGSGAAQQPPDPGDRELVERHVERIVIKSHAINVFLRLLETADEMNQVGPDSMADSDGNGSNPVMLALPWTAPRPIAARDKPA